MNLQNLAVSAIVTIAFLHVLTLLAPARWRARISSRLGTVARNPSCGRFARWLATHLGRAVAPHIGCGGCAGRARGAPPFPVLEHARQPRLPLER